MSAKEIMITEDLAVEEAAELRENILKLIDQGEKDFILNFRGCTFIDSTGLGVLVGIYKRIKEIGGNLEFKEVVEPKVLKVFKLTRLDKVFGIE